MISSIRSRAGAVGIFAALMTGSVLAQTTVGPTALGEIASYSVSRGAIRVDEARAQGYGYYIFINGLGTPIQMFNGIPGPNTALFTFRTSLADNFPLPDNLDQRLVVSGAATYDIYFNASPTSRNWQIPEDFMKGIKVATFSRTAFLGTILNNRLDEAFSGDLLSSTPFQFNGKTYDFKNITLSLTTENTFSAVPAIGLGPSLEFPVAVPFSGKAVVTRLGCDKPQIGPTPEICKGSSATLPTAVASPRNLSAIAREITLDGSQSKSADGKALTYQWTAAEGTPAVSIINADTATPTVRFSNLSFRGAYGFKLTVTDSNGTKATDTATINFQGTGN